MSMSAKDRRETTAKALAKYIQKQTQDTSTPEPSRKNKQPEALVVRDLLKWLRQHGADVSVIEAKSSFSEKTHRYTSQSVAPGFSDIQGNFANGLALYVEAKAPGRLSTLRDAQREFLFRKIETNAFAVCVDSVEMIEEMFSRWRSLLNAGEKREFLRARIVTKKEFARSDLFQDQAD